MRKRHPQKSSVLSDEIVLQALSKVIDPELGRDLVTLGMIKDLAITGGLVSFTLRLTTPACPLRDQLKAMAQQAVAAVPGVIEVRVKLDAQVRSGNGLPGKRPIPGVKQVIAVASGKGGVGKSTVAVNLALALSETKARVGLLDGDFYGPNVPQMLGSQGSPIMNDQRITPIRSNGLQVMSFAYLIGPGKPVIWRGPMLMGAIEQLLYNTEWDELDYLIVDLPPGTGDIPLSLVQLVPLAGVVIVTTPQRVALSDVIRSMEMFNVTGTPILGVVENMSFLACPDCGRRIEVFGQGGGKELAEGYNVPLLAQIPIEPEICLGGDVGMPAAKMSEQAAQVFRELAEKVAAQVSVKQFVYPNRMY